MKNNENNREKTQNNRTGWLEDFDPTASGPRTWTRQRLARGLGPKRRGSAPGEYNGETQRGNKMEK